MRKYLIALLALTIMMTTSLSMKAGSPEKCREALDRVLRQLKHKRVKFSSDHFWTLPDAEICLFKREAHKAKFWGQFATICNSLTPEECKSCKCGREDFTTATACSLKCAHCWSTDGSCFQ